MTRTIAKPPSGRSPANRLSAVVIAAFVSSLIVAAGCDQRASNADAATAQVTTGKASSGDEHDHAAAEPKGDPHGHQDGAPDEHGRAHGAADLVTLTAEAVRRNGIRIGQARLQVLTARLSAPARVAYNAEQVAHISSAVTGRVAEIKVRLGDVVGKGDVLMVVDSPELGEAQSEFLQKRTAVEVAKPAVELAKDAYQRAQTLYDQSQGISLTEVQARKREYQKAQGELLSAQAAATAAENKLHLLGMDQSAVMELARTGEIQPRCSVRAPIPGRVIEREATLGELVSPEKEKLMVIADLSTVWVLADVPEAKLGQIRIGSPVQIAVAALAGHTFEGFVSYLSPELDPATRTARVRIEVRNAETKLMPGMFARADIAAGAADGEPVLAVPEEAVQTVEGQAAVFVPVEGRPNRFAPRQVRVGQPIAGMVPIFAGLQEGEQYVAGGSFILKAELGKAGAAHEH
ncbi:efflux RND transporter periplasmic adaptor subunit [Fontivita pretiosa]|uniref:efflux RND transporter periplasmic adaptor subunit n=1 Tax=Fontivita pretiosa TaxID=2989684 RepID=UPI003D16FEBA